MNIQVNDFRWEPGKNDAEYIKLLESSRDEWQKIAQKAIAKLKTLLKAHEPRIIDGEPECGYCLYELRRDADSYCPCCGRKIKWE